MSKTVKNQAVSLTSDLTQLTGIGDKMYIEGPEPVREEYKEFMRRVLGNYG